MVFYLSYFTPTCQNNIRFLEIIVLDLKLVKELDMSEIGSITRGKFECHLPVRTRGRGRCSTATVR